MKNKGEWPELDVTLTNKEGIIISDELNSQ